MSDDLLRMDYINSLPQPLYIKQADGWKWPLHILDVQTGCLQFDVCGKLQNGHIDEVVEFIDADGGVHPTDTFYTEFAALEGKSHE